VHCLSEGRILIRRVDPRPVLLGPMRSLEGQTRAASRCRPWRYRYRENHNRGLLDFDMAGFYAMPALFARRLSPLIEPQREFAGEIINLQREGRDRDAWI
jgi:hypothetical protein